MANRPPQRVGDKRPATGQAQIKHTAAAGISNRPPIEEEHRQQQLPPRGHAKKKTPGGKGGTGQGQ